MRALQRVVDVVGRGDIRLAAGEGFANAQEADEVGAVGVEVLSVFRGLRQCICSLIDSWVLGKRRREANLALVRYTRTLSFCVASSPRSLTWPKT